MRVLMFGWEFPPYTTGGLGTHCYNLTKALSKKKVKITFVMPKVGKGMRHGFVKVIHAEDAKFIEIVSNLIPYVPSFDIMYSPSEKGKEDLYGMDFFSNVNKYTEYASRVVKKEECDIIHCHDWMTYPVGVRVKKEKKKPLVVTVHSTEYDRNPLSPNPWITHTEWMGMYEADSVIVVSEYMKNRIMEKYSVPEGKIHIIYNAVDAESYRGEKIRFGTGDRVVLFLGRLTIQKGPDYFLRAARRVLDVEKNVRFIVVGTGHMLPELIDQSIRMGIADNVIFTGYAESINEYYKMADMYVMPSVSEPFGITALEAMASGTPIILSKQSGVSEVVRHCMKVDFWDVDEMANKIIGLLRYGTMKNEMEKNGSMEVSSINWDSVAVKTSDVYSVVSGG